jgi:alpha-ketoglutarate-dependent taurine dioxygenase
MLGIDYGAAGFDGNLTRALGQDGAVCVHGMGTSDATLLEVAGALGEIIAPGVGMPSGAHDGRIYTVEVRNDGAGLCDQHGNTVLSTTSHEFSLHTDAYNQRIPPTYVLLLRSDGTDDETPSFLSDAHYAIADLPADTVAVLRSAIFPSALGPTSIVEQDGSGLAVRFNAEEIARWDGREDNLPISSEGSAAIAALQTSLIARQETTVILPGDCLIIDNQRVCHGRGRMLSSSRRVLKRVWVV